MILPVDVIERKWYLVPSGTVSTYRGAEPYIPKEGETSYDTMEEATEAYKKLLTTDASATFETDIVYVDTVLETLYPVAKDSGPLITVEENTVKVRY